MNRTSQAGTAYGGSGTSVQPLLACSACAGDYEDPDRTAGASDLEDTEETEEGEGVTFRRSSSREGAAEARREMAGGGAGGRAANRENANGDGFPATEK